MRVRFDIWLHPMDYYSDEHGAKSFQTVETMFGMGWGGLIGRGFGDGSPERVPLAESDFIIAAIGEELGLTGVIAVILLYGLIVERALRTALICRDGFGKLVATGLARRLRAPGLRRRRRRHPPDPADRPDHPVPVVRRLVAGGQLGDHRVAARISDQARRPPPDLTPDDGVSDDDATQVVKLR